MSLPSCLTMVNRVLEECGDVVVASLNPGTRNSKIALEALNDASAVLWKRQRWPWQKQTATFALVANQADYPLPARFGRLSEPVRIVGTSGFTNLQEFTPEFWNERMQGAWATIGNAQTGQPRAFKIDNTTMSLFPAPSADFITTYPNLTYAYFQGVPPRRGITDGANSWDLPDEFYEAMILYGKSRLKQYLSFPDAQTDMGLFEAEVRQLLAKVREGRMPAQMRPARWIVSEW